MIKLFIDGSYENEPICEVKNGQIAIKSKRYSINLPDGYYKMRKPTVAEYETLQRKHNMEANND